VPGSWLLEDRLLDFKGRWRFWYCRAASGESAAGVGSLGRAVAPGRALAAASPALPEEAFDISLTSRSTPESLSFSSFAILTVPVNWFSIADCFISSWK